MSERRVAYDMRIQVAALLKQPIGAHDDYHVGEDPVDPRGQNASMAEAGISAFDANVRATHTDPGAYLEGDARATIEQFCSRCLKPISTRVETEFAEQYYQTIGVVLGEPKPEPPEDSKTIDSDFRIDLTPLIREELILAIPLVALCRPDCKGLCPECGRDLNDEPHEHEQPIDDRWSALKRLREDETVD